MWNSPVPRDRWDGFRRDHRGVAAFESVSSFEEASVNELASGLEDHELATLGRLLARGKKLEIEVFLRTHGPNPLFNPQDDIDHKVGVAKADVVSLGQPASAEAAEAILKGEVAHILFQAGEASRFQEGPLYSLNPVTFAQAMVATGGIRTNGHSGEAPDEESLVEEAADLLDEIEEVQGQVSPEVARLLLQTGLGPKQPILIRAAVRRVIENEIAAGRISPKQALARYREALDNQKIVFFVSARGEVNAAHDTALRTTFSFYGFKPENLVTIEQELARGIAVNEQGETSLIDSDWARDAGGHLYALIQAARTGGFTTYTESGRTIKPMELDAFSYLINKGARWMSVVRINDMDRHTTEIINPKALSHALSLFADGYVNAIETVANPSGQKGGTGTTFGDPSVHVLTETHENSFPSLSRAFETAMQDYLQESQGRHPAYNAMRQWADLAATRRALKEFGGRIVFVPRQKKVNGEMIFYAGVDMPMGDLSLLHGDYKSRMFQFADPAGRELLIHDMKTRDNLPLALRAVVRQLTDPRVVTAVEEVLTGKTLPFDAESSLDVYGAPAPEFES